MSKLRSPFAERIGGDRLDRDINGRAGLERVMERTRSFRLDADDPDPAGEPGREAGNQSAAADRDEHGIELRQDEPPKILLPFEGDRPRARDRLGRVIGMDQERPGFGDIGVAAFLRLRICGAADHRLRAIGPDLGDLRGRGNLRHEDARPDAELGRCVGDRRAVISARGGGAASGRGRSGEKIVERPSRLERTRMLEALELQRNRRRAGDRRGSLDQRRAAHVRGDSVMGGANVRGRHCRLPRRLTMAQVRVHVAPFWSAPRRRACSSGADSP